MNIKKAPSGRELPTESGEGVYGGGDYFAQSSKTNLQYPKIPTPGVVNNYTVTEYTTYKNIKYKYSASFTTYGAIAAFMVVTFVIPGITLRATDDGLIFHCDTTVTSIPAGDNGDGCIQNIRKITEADMQKSTISEIPTRAFLNAASLKRVIFPNTLRTIGREAFNFCKSLSEVTIPDGVTSLGQYAFKDCQSLLEISLSDTVTTLSYGAFMYCTNLSQIAIPASVTSIGDSAFSGCTALKIVDCSACTKVPTLGASTFANVPTSTLQIKVPAALYDEWIAATNWSTYASCIVAV